MSQRASDEKALREILNSLGEGGTRASTPTTTHLGGGADYGAPDPWRPLPETWQATPAPYTYDTQSDRRAGDTMLQDHLNEFVQDLLTKGTPAHAIGTFLLVVAIIACVMWVAVAYLLPMLRIMMMELLAALMPLIILIFAMCLCVSTLFRR